MASVMARNRIGDGGPERPGHGDAEDEADGGGDQHLDLRQQDLVLGQLADLMLDLGDLRLQVLGIAGDGLRASLISPWTRCRIASSSARIFSNTIW